MIFREAHLNDPDSVICLGKYYPYRLHGDLNPAFDEWSGRILDLKEGKSSAIEYFLQDLEPLLSDGFAITVVPSHTPGKTNSGIRQLAERLVTGRRINALSCLVRHTEIPKLARGGNRDLTQHLQTIRVENAHLIRGPEVLLLDDVMTSGNSISACQQLLQRAGAALVQPVVLGKTVRG